MNILALEPYYGGSHRAFLDGLSTAGRHEWTVLNLPAYKWKWRMRHSAVTFASQVTELLESGRSWDIIFCSDMLNLAEFVGLVHPIAARLPKVIYFHENQLTYPVRVEDERDYQFAMTNLTSAIAADEIWFNSQFHMESFLDALMKFLKSMPDHQPIEQVEKIREKSLVYPPGINDFPARTERRPGPLRILWAARWEHDKNPEDFFDALEVLKNNDVRFEISVIGQSFRESPGIFEKARKRFNSLIVNWGYQESRREYENILLESDVVVSTANHEFFGLSVLEATAAGAYPLVPNRLSYPEIFGLGIIKGAEQFFYNGSTGDLADKLTELAVQVDSGTLWPKTINAAVLTDRFKWKNLAAEYDYAFEKVRLSCE